MVKGGEVVLNYCNTNEKAPGFGEPEASEKLPQSYLGGNSEEKGTEPMLIEIRWPYE